MCRRSFAISGDDARAFSAAGVTSQSRAHIFLRLCFLFGLLQINFKSVMGLSKGVGTIDPPYLGSLDPPLYNARRGLYRESILASNAKTATVIEVSQ